MDQKSYLAIAAMLNAFPQGSANPDLILKTFEAIIGDASGQAIVEAAQRFCAGSVKDQSLKFAPSVAEFAREVERCAEMISIRSRPRIEPPRYSRGPLAPFEVAQEKALAANAHLPVLFEHVSHDEARVLSRQGKIPVGGKWVAATGTVYGPAPVAREKAA